MMSFEPTQPILPRQLYLSRQMWLRVSARPVDLACLLGRPGSPLHQHDVAVRGRCDRAHANRISHIGERVLALGVLKHFHVKKLKMCFVFSSVFWQSLNGLSMWKKNRNIFLMKTVNSFDLVKATILVLHSLLFEFSDNIPLSKDSG